MRKFHAFSGAVVAFAVLAVAGMAFAAEGLKVGTTLENLNAAYNGESNAKAKYEAFAKKADEEGYTKVASLFRAAALSEDIHAKRHAEVIQKLGGKPTADVKTPEVKSTKENLEAALTGESYERDEMYPKFIEAAKTEGVKEAVKTFNGAKSAEAEHAKFYAEALQNLDAMKGGAETFYVCQVCGFTAKMLPADKCPVCSNPKDKFTAVQ